MDPYLLHREQWIPQPIEDVFDFFADAKNLIFNHRAVKVREILGANRAQG